MERTIIILTIVAVVAFVVFFFLPNSAPTTEEFACNQTCPGSGSLVETSKLYLLGTKEKEIQIYTKQILKYVNRPKLELSATDSATTQMSLQTANTILQSIYIDDKFPVSATPRPIGMLKINDVLRFVTKEHILYAPSAGSGELRLFFKYFPCVDSPHTVASLFMKHVLMSDSEEGNILDTRQRRHAAGDFKLPLSHEKVRSPTMSLHEAKLIAIGLGDKCIGFTCKIDSDTAETEDESMVSVNNLKFRTAPFKFKDSVMRLDIKDDQFNSILTKVTSEYTSGNSSSTTIEIPSANNFVGFEKSFTGRVQNKALISHYMSAASDAFTTGVSIQPNKLEVKDGHTLQGIPETGRRYCAEGGYSRNCCFRTNPSFDKDFPEIPSEQYIRSDLAGSGSSATDEALAEFTCPYYVDNTFEGNLYKRDRESGNCCRFAPASAKRCEGMAVSKEDMYGSTNQEDDSEYKCSESDPFFHDKCNARCEFIAKEICKKGKNTKECLSVSKKDANNNTVYPNIFRRDLARCVYTQDKCKFPTVESCNTDEFKTGCSDACKSDCNGYLEFKQDSNADDMPNPYMQRQFEDTGMCRDGGRAVYKKEGSMIDNYFTGIKSLVGRGKALGGGNTASFAYGNTVAFDPQVDPCSDGGCKTLSADRTEEGDYVMKNDSEVMDLVGDSALNAPYKIKSYNNITRQITLQGGDGRQYSIFNTNPTPGS